MMKTQISQHLDTCSCSNKLSFHIMKCFIKLYYIHACINIAEQFTFRFSLVKVLHNAPTISKLNERMNTNIQCVPEKRLPFEVKRQFPTFEFECFNSLISPRMCKRLLQRIFMHALQINSKSFCQNNSQWAHMGGKTFKFERAALALNSIGSLNRQLKLQNKCCL